MTSAIEASAEENENPSTEKKPAGEAPIPGNRPRKKRRIVVRVAAAALAVAALVFGVLYYVRSLSHESTDDAFIDGHVIAVSPRVSGHVARVYVADNQWVKAGERLVDLDPADFQVRLDAAEAALAGARATRRSRNVEVDLTTITTAADLDGAEG